jgi:uncharacterized SAM-binding protein YcdF (DUF218 family)
MRRKQVAIITFIVLIVVAICLNRERILLAVGDFLVVQDKFEPADIIHVIAGPDHRTDYGIQLYKKDYAKRIFFTGGWCPFHNVYHGEHGKERALEQGIPLEAIAINDSQVRSTYDEVIKLKEFMTQAKVPIHSVIVISDPHHMRRARWTYRQVLGNNIRITMAPVPFGLSPYKRNWWKDRASKRMVKDEYVKFGYYLVRYQLSWGPLKDWLSTLDRN